jgi:DNA processing protein
VALSRAALVVEMGLKSGAQHTVGYALEQGKDVLAVPGPITSGASAGTNQLIRDGAGVVTSARDVEDLLEALAGSAPRVAPEASVRRLPRSRSRSSSSSASTSTAVLAALDASPRHVDELSASTEIVPGALLGTLLELELRGMARSLPGKQFCRA